MYTDYAATAVTLIRPTAKWQAPGSSLVEVYFYAFSLLWPGGTKMLRMLFVKTYWNYPIEIRNQTTGFRLNAISNSFDIS